MAAHGKQHQLRPPKDLPLIPWTNKELEGLRERGEDIQLLFEAPGLTMQELVVARDNQATDGGKLLYAIDWYQKEVFYTAAPTAKDWRWRLAGNTILPDSTSQDYLGQTAIIAAHLKAVVFRGRKLPLVYRRAIAEFKTKRAAIAKLIGSDQETEWKKGAKQCATLKLNQLCRETAVELLYRLITYEAVNGERLLQNYWHWTPTLSSYGELIRAGDFDRNGVFVGGWDPEDSRASLGVVLSRRGEVESEK